MRQPPDADEEAEKRCRRNAQHRHKQSVQKPYGQNAAIAVVFVIVDEGLVDTKASALVEKPETRSNVLAFQI